MGGQRPGKLATAKIKDEDDYYFTSETPRLRLRLQPHPPMPRLPRRCSESESEDIESDDASTVTTTTTEDTENNDTDVPSEDIESDNDNPGTTTANMSLPRPSQPKTRLLPEGPLSPSSGSPTQSHDNEDYWRRYAAQIQHENDSVRKQLINFEERITRAEEASDDATARLMESSRNEEKLREKLETAEMEVR